MNVLSFRCMQIWNTSKASNYSLIPRLSVAWPLPWRPSLLTLFLPAWKLKPPGPISAFQPTGTSCLEIFIVQGDVVGIVQAEPQTCVLCLMERSSQQAYIHKCNHFKFCEEIVMEQCWAWEWRTDSLFWEISAEMGEMWNICICIY